MILNSGGILRFYTTLQQQHHRKALSEGDLFPVAVAINQVPPFQLARSTRADTITQFIIRPLSGALASNLASEAAASGLELQRFEDDGYDLIIWPSIAPIAAPPFAPGMYYVEMSDGVDTWYSEVFQMCSDLSHLLYLEYCHGEDFAQPGNTKLVYTANNYKNYLYLTTDGIAQPVYEFEDEVVKRNGYEYPLKQISYIQHRFNFIAPEWLLEQLRFVRQHDFVTIRWCDRTYDVDWITFTPNWEGRNISDTEMEFRTDTVVVVKGGDRGATCGVAGGGCYAPVRYVVSAYVVEGSAQYQGGYYIDAATGQQVNFEDGPTSIYLIEDETTAEITVRVWDGSVFTLAADQADLQYIYDQNEDDYYFGFATGISGNKITDLQTNSIEGIALPNSTVEIVLDLGSLGTQIADIVTAEEFLAGVSFDAVPGAVGAFIRVYNATCGLIYTGPTVLFDFACQFELEGGFAGIQPAIDGGVTAGQYYYLEEDNFEAMPEGLVMQMEPSPAYFSDDHAVAQGVAVDNCYPVAGGNFYGMPVGAMRAIVGATPIYSNDAAAAAGGVGVGEIYVCGDTLAGIPVNYLKVRLT
jgi:hypothetical protein